MSTHRTRKNEVAPFDGLIIGEDLPKDLVRRMGASRRYLIGNGNPEHLIRLVLCSSSLDAQEKIRVLDAMPTLSQFQIDELTRTFEDERKEFSKLRMTEYVIISKLQVQSLHDSMRLVAEACQVSPPLIAAWTRRLIRRANSRGLLAWIKRHGDCECSAALEEAVRPHRFGLLAEAT